MCCNSEFQKGLALTILGSVLLLKALEILSVDFCSLVYGGMILIGLSLMFGSILKKK